MSWEAQADGSVLGVATPRAVEWAADDLDKLAAIGFVAWCRDSQLDPFWSSDDWRCLACGPYVLEALRDHSTDHGSYAIPERTDAPWVGVVRVMSGPTPVIHILGVSHTAPTSGPRSLLLSCREWLRAFPIHHAIPPEVFESCSPSPSPTPSPSRTSRSRSSTSTRTKTSFATPANSSKS